MAEKKRGSYFELECSAFLKRERINFFSRKFDLVPVAHDWRGGEVKVENVMKISYDRLEKEGEKSSLTKGL